MIVDSHCHLSSFEDEQVLENVMNRARQAGVGFMLNAGAKFDELLRQLNISRKYKNVWTLTGVHPHDSAEYENITARDVLQNTLNPQVIGIGECGLDYYYDFAPRDVQIKVFKQMILAAQESGLPLVVHTREAEDDTMELLRQAYLQKTFKGVIHCFSSDFRLARAALELGFYISASGIITFKNSQDIRDSFKQIPLDRLLIETDSPYLAPVPLRGKTNEPSYIVHTAHQLAKIKNLDFNEICDITTSNFFHLFEKADRK